MIELGKSGSNVSSFKPTATTSTTDSVHLFLPSKPAVIANLTQPAPYQHLKLVKRGFRGGEACKVCGVSFEVCPAWIWAFRLSDWTTIYVTDVDELRLRQEYETTWTVVRDIISIISPHQIVTMMGRADVWFTSGSRSFLDQFEGPESIPIVMWLEKGGRRRPADTKQITWFGVSHETVGGSTTARGSFARSGLDDLEIPLDPLRRSIAHVLKHSIRPTPCSLSLASPHYLVSERLSISHVDKPVMYQTRMSRSGWGVRRLEDVELSQAFDLPPHLSWDMTFPTRIVPIQIFRVIVDAVLTALRPSGQPGIGPRMRATERGNGVVTVLPLARDAVWLDALKRWLPGSWANVTISDRAVKADDATVEQYPWNQRISLG